MKKQTTIKASLIGLLALLTLNLELSGQDYYPSGSVSSTYSGRSQDLSKLPKMDRDIIILQNVLNDLFNGDRGSFYSSGGAKGIYVPGKGVIFNVGQNNHSGSFALVEDILISQTAGSNTPKEEKSASEVNKETESRIERLSEEFLVSYGSILSELKSGEKVMLNVNYSTLNEDKSDRKKNTTISGQAQVIYRSSYGRSIKKRMVSSIDYSAINSYLNGKSSLKEAAQKIDKNIVDKSGNSAQDAKIMAGILDDLFQSNFEGNFRRSRKTSWTYFEGFGLMYDLNLTGNRRSNIIAYTVNGGTTDGVSISNNDEKNEKDKEAKKAELEANYKRLIDMVKESMITYGRTLRSVKGDEVVILNINFGSSFRKTDIPRAVRLQVTKKQIEAFSKGQKSLDQLKNEIDIKKLSASTSHGSDFFEVPSVGDYESIIYETAPEPTTPLRRVTSGKAKKSN